MRLAKTEPVACDLFLAVGSSLAVYPTPEFPGLAKKSVAVLMIVNREPTGVDILVGFRRPIPGKARTMRHGSNQLFVQRRDNLIILGSHQYPFLPLPEQRRNDASPQTQAHQMIKHAIDDRGKASRDRNNHTQPFFLMPP